MHGYLSCVDAKYEHTLQKLRGLPATAHTLRGVGLSTRTKQKLWPKPIFVLAVPPINALENDLYHQVACAVAGSLWTWRTVLCARGWLSRAAAQKRPETVTWQALCKSVRFSSSVCSQFMYMFKILLILSPGKTMHIYGMTDDGNLNTSCCLLCPQVVGLSNTWTD